MWKYLSKFYLLMFGSDPFKNTDKENATMLILFFNVVIILTIGTQIELFFPKSLCSIG